MDGVALHDFATQLYPYCRSITGNGVRQTLSDIAAHIPLKRTEVPSGRTVYDWTVPQEWNVESASIEDSHCNLMVDFADHNLHLVSYSEPQDVTLPLRELRSKLHVSGASDSWIPYRTSYYKRDWGFCVRARDLATWKDGLYRVRIDSRLTRGALSYGEFVLPGARKSEVLLFTHVCHPSLANDNLSGIAIATALAQWLQEAPRRFSYRIVFAPGTIGSLCWLKANEAKLGRVEYGMVLGLLGDESPLTWKRSRQGNARIDAVAEYALRELTPQGRCIDFEPYGYDERQLCSPGFNLPVGRLTRAVNGGYPEYHSSGDDLGLITPDDLQASLVACQRIIEIIESNRSYRNLSPKGEPQLGKRGLYGAMGGLSPQDATRALLWVLNQSDGQHSLLDIARRAGLPYDQLSAAAESLEDAGLLREAGARPARRPQKKKGRKK